MDETKYTLKTDNHRTTNLELLRIVAMLMIVCSHYILHGGVINQNLFHKTKYVVLFLESAVFVSVNIYVLISAYFLSVKPNFTIGKLIPLWGIPCFYAVTFYICQHIFFDKSITFITIFHTLLPIRYNAYWFVTAYTGMYVLSPYLSKIVVSLTQKEYLKLLSSIFLFFSFYSGLSIEADPFRIGSGYGPLWFILLFFIGGYLRRYKPKVASKSVFSAYLICCMANAIAVSLSRTFLIHCKVISDKVTYGSFFQFNSPFILIASICLFIYFDNLKIRPEVLRTWILKIAPLTFGVYLIHDSNFMRSLIWKEWLMTRNYYNPRVLFFHLIFSVISVFIICACVEKCRQLLFNVVGKFLSPITKYIKGKFDIIMAKLYLKLRDIILNERE